MCKSRLREKFGRKILEIEEGRNGKLRLGAEQQYGE